MAEIREEMQQEIQQNMQREIEVSVIIPAYNCAGLISQAIDSALRQEVPLEVIVIDDGSGDNLDEVMEAYRDNPVLSYIKNEKNLGVSGTRNKGVSLAKGKYVAFLDADDYWADGKLQKQLACMKEKNVVLSCTARELMTPEGELTGRVIPVREEITYAYLLHHNSINCSSVVLKTEVAKAYPMCHDDSHEDYLTWLRILQKQKRACGIPEPLLKYRLSNQGKSGNKIQSAKMTFLVYRYLGFGYLKSCYYFALYALHGVWKYSFSGIRAVAARLWFGQ